MIGRASASLRREDFTEALLGGATVMNKGTCCFKKYGERVALLTLIPGWGQFRNRQYIKAAVVAVTFLILIYTAVALSVIPLITSHAPLSINQWELLFFALVVWEASLFDAFYKAIERRRQDAQRHTIELGAKVSGFDSTGRQFYENAVTRNLSKVGACLALPNGIRANSKLSVEFLGKKEVPARVIWSKPRGVGTSTLVGVEFHRPLKAL
jgi:hypothetical protein